jgi:antitoxin component of RelBE/YafQ-DinJ toxin-antitoxin module
MADAPAAAPGMPNLPATLDNFDAIVGSYDNAPDQSQAADDGFELPPQPNQRNKQQAKPTSVQEPVADELGDEGVELDEEGNPIEQEAAPDEVAEPDDFELVTKAKDWLERPDLPEEFLSKTGVAKVDGEEHVITVKEAFEGFQRRAISTQRQQEAAQVKNYYTNLLQGWRQQTQQWTQNPEAAYTELGDMGIDVDAVARVALAKYAEDQRVLDGIADPQLRQFTAQRLAAGRKAEAEKRARDRELAAARNNSQQTQGQQQQAAIQQRTNHQMAQLAPRAFREVGVKITPATKMLLGEELSAIHQWGTDLTYDVVLEAMKNAKDRIDLKQQKALQIRAAGTPPRSRALPPRRQSGNPGTGPSRAGARNAPAKVSDFDKIMAEQDGRR